MMPLISTVAYTLKGGLDFIAGGNIESSILIGATGEWIEDDDSIRVTWSGKLIGLIASFII